MRIILTILIFQIPMLLQAQGKRIPIYPGANSIVYWLDAMAKFNFQADDTAVLMNKSKYIMAVKLENICGVEGHEVVIMLEDETVPIGGYTDYSFVLNKAANVVLYHLNIDGKNKGRTGIAVGEASNIRIQTPKVRNTSGIGIRVKTDPVATDKTTLYPYIMKNIWVDSADVENTGAEGGYFGHSLTSIDNLNGGLPQAHVGLTITHWRSRHTGWDGLQISHSQETKVEDVAVYDYGYLNQPSQRNGFVSGGSVTYRAPVKKVSIVKGPGSGFAIFSKGLIVADSVETKDAGTAVGESGIYIDDFASALPLAPQQVELYNVTVDGAQKSPLFYYNKRQTAKPIKVQNFHFQNTGIGVVDNSHGTFTNDTIPVVVPPIVVPKPIDTLIKPADSPIVLLPEIDSILRSEDTDYINRDCSISLTTWSSGKVIVCNANVKIILPDTPQDSFQITILNPTNHSVKLSKRLYFTNGKYRLIVGYMMKAIYKAKKGKYYITDRKDFTKKRK